MHRKLFASLISRLICDTGIRRYIGFNPTFSMHARGVTHFTRKRNTHIVHTRNALRKTIAATACNTVQLFCAFREQKVIEVMLPSKAAYAVPKAVTSYILRRLISRFIAYYRGTVSAVHNLAALQIRRDTRNIRDRGSAW